MNAPEYHHQGAMVESSNRHEGRPGLVWQITNLDSGSHFYKSTNSRHLNQVSNPTSSLTLKTLGLLFSLFPPHFQFQGIADFTRSLQKKTSSIDPSVILELVILHQILIYLLIFVSQSRSFSRFFFSLIVPAFRS